LGYYHENRLHGHG